MAPIIKKTTTRSTSSVMVRRGGEMPWRAKLIGERGHVWRYSNNPIIRHDALSYSNSIFNSAVVPFKGGYAGVFRCDDTELKRSMNVGFSVDGIHWTIDEKPIEFTATKKGIPECCQPYDPRITEIDGRYYITWCNVYHGPTLGFGYTDDFKTFHLLEPISTPYNRNGVLFPRKVNGKYILLSGPTAVIQSFCKMDFRKLPNGVPLELKLHPSSLKGEGGLDVLVGLMKTFLRQGGVFLHIDVVDSALLREAQVCPERYPNLAVRISGWSARFTTLDKQWQDMIIQRTMHD